jgi:hypothetical protein
MSFKDHTINTTIYVKMDAGELSEGVCHQLGIVSYHPAVAAVAESKYATVRVVNVITSTNNRTECHYRSQLG